jgi:hypothetical protein
VPRDGHVLVAAQNSAPSRRKDVSVVPDQYSVAEAGALGLGSELKAPRAFNPRRLLHGSLHLEILDLRHFSSVDLRPPLEDELGVWANACRGITRFSGNDSPLSRLEDTAVIRGH